MFSFSMHVHVLLFFSPRRNRLPVCVCTFIIHVQLFAEEFDSSARRRRRRRERGNERVILLTELSNEQKNQENEK